MYRATGISIAAALLCSACSSILPYMGQQDSAGFEPPTKYMSESIRQSVHAVDVVADASKPKFRIGGDYGQQTTSLSEGASEGASAGVGWTSEMIAEDPRAILVAPVALPIFVMVGTITGAAAAKIEQQLKDFRDGLADKIAADNVPSISGRSIAEEVMTLIDSGTDITHGSDDADADLVVVLDEIEISTRDKDAFITTSATVVLRSRADGTDLYRKSFDYAEFDSLTNWGNSDEARWSSYVDRAKYFLGVEIVGDLFQTIHVRNVLRPIQSQTFSGGWQGDVESKTPTLAWELFLLGGDEYRDRIDRAEVRFQLRIFDEDRLVYEARDIEGNSHAVSEELPACRPLRWTVRPIYYIDGKTRTGDWMRYRGRASEIWDRSTSNKSSTFYAAIDPWCKS